MADGFSDYDPWSSSEARGSRRLEALFADTKDWIRKLEDDAHWARDRETRTANLEKAQILKDLLERAR